MSDSEIFLPNMRIYRLDRPKGQHGGILVGVNSNFTLDIIDIGLKQCDWCVIKISNDYYSIMMLVIYNASLGSRYRFSFNYLEQVFECFTTYANSCGCRFLIVGDFNFPCIDWLTFISSNKEEEDFIQLIDKLLLKQIINFPTHKSGHILDLLFTTFQSDINATAVDDIGITSDHTSILLNVPVQLRIKADVIQKASIPKHLVLSVSKLSSSQISIINEDLNVLYHDLVNHSISGDSLFNYICNCVQVIFNKHFTISYSTVNRAALPAWVSSRSSHLLNKKRTMINSLNRHYSNSINKNKLPALLERIEVSLTEDFIMFHNNITTGKYNHKSLFRFINNIRQTTNCYNCLDENYISFADDASKANAFNLFFNSVYRNDNQFDADIISNYIKNLKIGQTTIMEDFNFTLEDISHAIDKQKLRHSKYSSIGISAIKTFKAGFLPILNHLFNNILLTGVFPNCWKTATVIPIPKVKKPTNISDYRPISILEDTSKIFERLIYDSILKHCNRYFTIS